jgi:hypothetical protein
MALKENILNNGAIFSCPYCLKMLEVGHFHWTALECLYCKNTIDMDEYINSEEGSWLIEEEE